MGIMPYVTKAVGAGAATFLIKDAVHAGIAEGKHESEAEVGEYLTDVFVSHQNSGDGYESTEKIKHSFRNYLMDSNVFSPILELKCISSMLVEKLAVSAVPIGLALTAMMTKINKGLKLLKGFIPSIIGYAALAGLAISASQFFKEKVLPHKHI